MDWLDVGAAPDQETDTLRAVNAAGTAVVLVRTARGWSAFEDRCPHAGAPLSAGLLRDGVIVCAWHGWRFDAATGACPMFPGAPAPVRRDVKVEGGRVLVSAVPAK